jgi:hypothetical protein
MLGGSGIDGVIDALSVWHARSTGHQDLHDAGMIAEAVNLTRRQQGIGRGDEQRGPEAGVGRQPVGDDDVVFRMPNSMS